MPNTLVPAAATGLPSISRRVFLRGAASAGAVAGVAAAPAVSSACAQAVAVAPSDAERLETILAELKAVLRRLHPAVTDVSAGYWPQPDGTFRLRIGCTRRCAEWSGPGLYSVSLDGHPHTFWLDRVEERTRAGALYGHVFHAELWLEDEGRFAGGVRQMWSPNILEKLDGGAAGAGVPS